MKIIQKFLCILVFTILLAGIAIYFAPTAQTPLPQFAVSSPNGLSAENIPIFDAEDGNYYVFLPSYADLEQVSVVHTQAEPFFLGETPLVENLNCGVFKLETPYIFSAGGQQIATLWFYQSANVATMYIDTVSGNMKYLHQNTDHKETASITLYTDAGRENYSHERISLSGRGNITWEYDKRPYTMTLPEDHALLDMAPAAKWVLLANAADETNLNNKLILDLATRLGIQWTPQCRWVDLYLNGEYSGLYLLAEKVEVHQNRLQLDTHAGDFLCRIDLSSRWSTLRNPFLTAAGRTTEICFPNILGTGDQSRVENLVNRLEETILSGADLNRSPILDLDSWVRKYLIDEIFANIDADLASSYFYYSDGVFFAGPLWDYDMTLGNYPRNQNPQAFIAKNALKSDTLSSPFYSALYANPSFHQRMVDLYRREFVPELQKMMDSEIDRLISTIHNASRSNSLRWRTMYDNLPADVVHTPSALKEYFANRITFLNRAWIDGAPYCTIQFESTNGSAYRTASVEKGQIPEIPYINTETVIWLDSVTGEVFDFSQPVTTDRILSKQHSAPEASQAENALPDKALSMIDYVILLLIIVPVFSVFVLIILDLRLRKK